MSPLVAVEMTKRLTSAEFLELVAISLLEGSCFLVWAILAASTIYFLIRCECLSGHAFGIRLIENSQKCGPFCGPSQYFWETKCRGFGRGFWGSGPK